MSRRKHTPKPWSLHPSDPLTIVSITANEDICQCLSAEDAEHIVACVNAMADPGAIDLIPPDPKQCQADKPNGASFMSMGAFPALVRCSNVPSVIITETMPGKDGLIGSMSLCQECLEVAKIRLQNSFQITQIETQKQ